MLVLPEIREILNIFKAYLEKKSSIQELYCYVKNCYDIANNNAHEEIILLLEDWLEMINRRWNEWGEQKNPISDEEFCEWLKKQIINSKFD